MTATVTQAKDEIFALISAAWLADATSLAIPVLWQDVSVPPPSTATADGEVPSYARVSLQHADGGPVTLSGDLSTKRYRRSGIITVQIFTPYGQGTSLSDILAQIVMDSMQGKSTTPGDVIFRGVRPNEIGQDGVYFHNQVLAQFEYDEVK